MQNNSIDGGSHFWQKMVIIRNGCSYCTYDLSHFRPEGRSSLGRTYVARLIPYRRINYTKRILLSLLGLTLCASGSFAQNVSVAGATGANGSYVTLRAAFTA